MSTPEELERRAERHGLIPRFTDVKGVERQAPPETMAAVLSALGIDPEADEPPPVVDPAVAAFDRRPVRLPVRVAHGAELPVRIEPEEGEALELVLPVRDRAIELPAGLAYGYHRVLVTTGGAVHESLLISAPGESYVPEDEGRRRALFLPLYALRRSKAEAAGDYGALAEFAEWAGRAGKFQVSTLPLYAGFYDRPFEPSPYAPASRLFLSEFYVEAAGGPGGPKAKEVVDYRAVAKHRRKRIEAQLADLGPDAVEALLAAARERPVLREYATFRAEVERRGVAWPAWKHPARDGALPPAREDDPAYRYHLFAGRLAEEQLDRAAERARESGGGLQLDLPVGVATDSFDVWRWRELFVTGASVGAPPDEFFTKGQDWGFPPLHPEAIRRDGYRYVRRFLAFAMRRATVLRIDHAMGLFRLYFVPRGHPATQGVYVRYPAGELAAILSLESHRHRCRIVGENLGTVPPEVDRLMERHRFAGMSVVQFTAKPDPKAPLPPPPAGSSASVNTHDLATFAGWIAGHDVDDRVERGLQSAEDGAEEKRGRAARAAALAAWLHRKGLLDSPEAPPVALHAALAEHLGDTDAGQVLLNLEDFWGEEEPQNWPGTSNERPNFARVAAKTLQEIAADRPLAKTLARIAAARDRRPALPASAPPDRPRRLTSDDFHLFNEGSHLDLAARLGSHPGNVEGRAGYWFSVWAPDAARVSVIGDFNGWDPERHPMAHTGSSGIFEVFVPDVPRGSRYKYRVVSRHGGFTADKADPFAVRHEVPPKTASITWDLDYEWGDDEWMAGRGARQAANRPMAVYEVHLGSFRRVPEEGDRPLTYRELAPVLAEHVKRTGFTHVEFMPAMEHPFYGSWGYQVTGYFAPTSRYGTPQDFMALIDHLHREGIGVILDWVPSHFPPDEHGLGRFDGTALFEHSDPRQGVHPDWGGYIFNYGRHEVRSFLMSAALHWLTRFHIDALRTDAVASMLYLDYSRKAGEWIPNEYGGRENLEAIRFLRRMNEEAYRRHPDVHTIAEESTAWPGVSRPTYAGGLGFGMKWDMGWMHDSLLYFGRDPIHRKWHHHELTFRGLYAFTERYMLPLSHDEVVHGKGSLLGKMPGDDWQRFANLRLLYAWMWAQPGKKLLFMGCEFGQRREWSHERSLDWHLLGEPLHAGLMDFVRDLNRVYREQPALFQRDFDPAGFEWVDGGDSERSVYSFLRKGNAPGEEMLCIFNATPTVRTNFRVGAPRGGTWLEILNGDAKEYGGSGQGNLGRVEAKPFPCHGRPFSLTLTLPPLAALYLAPAQ